jgi:hypothetical protein
MLGRRLVLIVLVALVAISLSGCAKKYVFNFKSQQSVSNGEGTWQYSDPVLFGDEGAYLDGNAITCPFRFSGDFTMEVYFYLNTAATNYMDWLEMYLIDADNWNYDVWVGMGMHQQGLDTSEYWAAQNGSSSSLTGILPGLEVDGDNKAEFIKEGDFIILKLNDEQVGSFVLTPANQIPYYRPFLSAYDDGTEQWKGAYIQKVVVKYEDGNIAP